jgi:hypothetical protein
MKALAAWPVMSILCLRVALDVLVEAPFDNLVVQAVDVARYFRLEHVAPGAFKQEPAGLGLPVSKEHEQLPCHTAAPEVLSVIAGEAAFDALQVPDVRRLPVNL